LPKQRHVHSTSLAFVAAKNPLRHWMQEEALDPL
jgi:hypothetical protein